MTQFHSFCHVLASQPKPGVEPEDAHLAPARRPEILPDFFTRVMNSLPQGRSLTFAYGSGVFEQHDNSKKNNMTDFIVAVKDSRTWHQDNMKMNPSHYAGLARHLGYSRIADIQVGRNRGDLLLEVWLFFQKLNFRKIGAPGFISTR